jgi:hypothetical protein
MSNEVSVRRALAQRYWQEAVLAELTERYREQGYIVEREVALQGITADLVARSGDRVEVVEVKSSSADEADRDALKQLRNYVAHLPNGSFKLVWTTPPFQPNIEVEGLKGVLNEIWSERVSETEAAELATHVWFESVADVEIESLRVGRDGIEISGSGIAEFEFQYGSGEDGWDTSDSYPFTFHVTLTHTLEVEEVHSLEVDVSSFYE